MVFGNSVIEKILPLLREVIKEISSLRLPNRKSPVSPNVTVSIGAATEYPSRKSEKESILEKADMLLYRAKEKGRNRIEWQGPGPL